MSPNDEERQQQSAPASAATTAGQEEERPPPVVQQQQQLVPPNHPSFRNNEYEYDDDELEKGAPISSAASANAHCTTPQQQQQQQLLTLRIQESSRHTQQQPMAVVTVLPHDTVAALKRAVVAATATTATASADVSQQQQTRPYVRLIAAGRLLAPDAATLDQFALCNHQVVHAVILQQPLQQQPQNQTTVGYGAQAILQHLSSSSSSSANNNSSNNSNSGSTSFTLARALRATGVNAAGWAVRRDPNEDDDDEDDDAVMFHHHHNDDEMDDDDDDDDDSILEDYDNSSIAAVVDLEAGGEAPMRARVRRNGSAATTGRRRGLPQHTLLLPLGFDSLRVTAGLSRAEIAVLRLYFGGHVLDRWLQQHPAVQQALQQQEPVDTLRRRRLEEDAWMEAQGPASEFRLNLNVLPPQHQDFTVTTSTTPAQQHQQQLRWAAMANAAATAGAPQDAMALHRSSSAGINSIAVVGTDRDFCWGFLLGFFVGFFMLVWVCMPTVPHKQKLGILTGYSFHLALGMLKAGNEQNTEEYFDDVVLLGE